MTKYFYYTLLLLTIFCTSLAAQDVRSLKSTGDKFFRQEYYRKALPFYEQILKVNPDDAEVVFRAGVCYLHKYSKEKALSYLLRAFELDSTVDKYENYWLGRAYHQNYEFDKALDNYRKYYRKLGKADQRKLELEKYIKQAEFAKKNVAERKNYLVLNLGPEINSPYSEHSPVISSNDSFLLFTTRRDAVTGGKEDYDGEYFEDIFQSDLNEDSTWGHPVSIGVNTSGHDASIQLLDNDTKLLLYRYTGEGGGDIYITEKANGQWQEPAKFGKINTPDFESHAFVTADGNTLFYATNHFKKKGDLDIYYMVKEANGSWSKIKELRGNINTEEDDDAPYLSGDGKTLYFSSRGHDNMGGFDIFKSIQNAEGTWSDPVNLGFPINTPDDDVYFYLRSDNYRSFISSYREGGYGEKDIYEVVPITTVGVEGEIVSEYSGKPVEGSEIVFTPSGKTSSLPISQQSPNGKYNTSLMSYEDYQVVIVKDKDTLYKDQVRIPLVMKEGTTIVKNFSVPYREKVDTTQVASADTAANTEAAKQAAERKREMLPVKTYFGLNRYDLDPPSVAKLDSVVKILRTRTFQKLEITGYTDATGNPQYNKTLSLKRAKTVMRYLVAKGIPDKKLKLKGLGPSNPVAENKTKAGRRQNRRVEFVIIK